MKIAAIVLIALTLSACVGKRPVIIEERVIILPESLQPGVVVAECRFEGWGWAGRAYPRCAEPGRR
jgi:hypothetical protein